MAVERDTLLKDLKNYVIDVFNEKSQGVRITLREDLLPELFRIDAKEKENMDEYHNTYPDFIGAWNINSKKWEFLDVNDVKYTQIIDGY